MNNSINKLIKDLGKCSPTVADHDWNSNEAWERLTIIRANSNNYISIKDVPIGIDVSDTEYWMPFSAKYDLEKVTKSEIDEMFNNIIGTESDSAIKIATDEEITSLFD
jgi:hypothetical protein